MFPCGGTVARYDPERSPFRKLRALQWLPSALTGRRRVRRWLSKYVKMRLKFKGYFDLYNIPFRPISLFDFTEKKSPLQPGGTNRGSNVFDHGMANCDQHLDLRAQIDALGFTMGEDYAVVYDSTMARFWFFNDQARRAITEQLGTVPEGHMMSDNELRQLGTYFPDRYFGELIFLVQEGTLIVPSHMGARPIRAMHGFHPDAPHSYAALMTNQADVSEEIAAIPDLFTLMTRDAECAHAANRSTASTVVRS